MKSPGRFASMGPRKWVVPGLAVVAAGVVWWAVRPPPPGPDTGRKATETAAAAARGTMDPASYVTARADTQNSANLNELIVAYGVWASRSDATEARKSIVKALLSHGNLQVGLEALLTAVESDQTPREKDPMWPELVAKVGSVWDAVTFRYGRDLAQLESRPKPKDLVIESLAAVRPERLADDQKPLLASDFIDMYATLKQDQKPAVDRAMAALAGKDVVEIMAGRGLTEGSKQLELVVERDRTLEAIRNTRVRERPAEE